MTLSFACCNGRSIHLDACAHRLAALAPMPLTRAEIVDLVARARLAQTDAVRQRLRIATLAAGRIRSHSLAIRVAVRYIALAGVPVQDAGRTIADITGRWVSRTAICSLWNKLYPGKPRPRGKPGRRPQRQ